MNIAFFGNGPWALNTLRALLPNHNVVLVADRKLHDGELENFAKTANLPFFSSGFRSVPDQLIEKSDLLVSISFDEIFPEEFLMRFRLGALNFHAGKLPEYRGRNPINWAIVNGEKDIWFTVHLIDSGIDTGNILREEKTRVRQTSNYVTILEKAYEMAPKLILEAIEIIQSTPSWRDLAVKQDEQKAKYRKKRTENDQVIDWSLSAEEIKRLVKALYYPGLWARTQHGHTEIKIIDGDVVAGIVDIKVGSIASVCTDHSNFIVGCGESTAFQVTEWTSPNFEPVIGERLG